MKRFLFCSTRNVAIAIFWYYRFAFKVLDIMAFLSSVFSFPGFPCKACMLHFAPRHNPLASGLPTGDPLTLKCLALPTFFFIPYLDKEFYFCKFQISPGFRFVGVGVQSLLCRSVLVGVIFLDRIYLQPPFDFAIVALSSR